MGAGFGAVLGLMILLIIVGLVNLSAIGAAARSLIEKDWVKAEAAHTIELSTEANARDTLQLLSAPDSDAAKAIQARVKANHDVIAAAEATLEKLVETPDGKNLLTRYRDRHTAYVASRNRVMQLVGQERKDEAVKLMFGETMPALAANEEVVQEIVALQKRRAEGSATKIAHEIASARLLMIGSGLAAVLLGIAFAWWLTRSITRPIDEAVKVARAVAKGDLTTRINVSSTDETGQLLHALAEMNRSLTGIVGQVRSGADTIATASSQIASGNQDLSSRTEEQAASLEETASSMEELTSTVRQNAQNAQQAGVVATNASEIASQGNAVVGSVVQAMTDISEHSTKIGEITGIIEGIAFQTNILALNAAVESARAGEHGRGFAVVASEVRSLAQRSSSAAKEIKELITASVSKVHDGSALAREAGRTMTDVTQAVARVADIMAEISEASGEQSRGIEQVDQAITQMDAVTQQNAALVEEAAAATRSLEDQGQQLTRAVAFFRLEAGTGNRV